MRLDDDGDIWPRGITERQDGLCKACGADIGCVCDARVRLGPCHECEKHECSKEGE